MNLSMRPYCDETDYWRVREFLRSVSMRNNRHEYSWCLLRWDYWRWHIHANIHRFVLSEVVFVWEKNGQLVAVVNADNPGEAFFQVDPAWRSRALNAEMLDVAEARLAVVQPDGRRRLEVWVPAVDTARKVLVCQRGYRKTEVAEFMRLRQLVAPVPDVPLADGYRIRALGGEDELPARSGLSWKVFHPDEPDDQYRGWEWYRNVQRVPLYRRDLDLVAEGPGGELAAFCTVWLDDVTRTAVFEPVGTHPDHQKRGLGKAIMAEGLRRAQRLGANLASVSSYSAAAHALYNSAGFTSYDLSESWHREW
jgi:mycothiol synthase